MRLRWRCLIGLASLSCVASCDSTPTEPTYQQWLMLTPSSPLLASDDSLQLVVHALRSARLNRPLFTSSDTSLVRVTSTGMLLAGGNTGAKPREATITLRDGRLSAKVVVGVAPAAVARVDVGVDSLIIVSGDTSAPLPLILRDRRGRALEKRPVRIKARTPRSAPIAEIVPLESDDPMVATTFRPEPDTTRTVVFVNIEGVTDSLTVIIVPREVSRIEIDSTEVEAERSTTLHWRALDAFGHLLTGRLAVITSLDSRMLSVSPTGVISAESYPDTTVRIGAISVKVERVTATHRVTVRPATAAQIAIDTLLALPEPGDTIPLSVAITSANGTSLVNRAVAFTSDDPSIVSVLSGTPTITATTYADTATRATRIIGCYATICDSVPITVAPSRIGSITLPRNELTLLAGSSTDLSATVLDRRGQPLVHRSVMWDAEDPIVASITPPGTLLGANFGGSRVTARAGGVSASLIVHVMALPEPTGIPTIWIKADGEILDRETWINARLTVGEGAADAIRLDAQIRGRGNSTWGMPKKPYRIRLRSEAGVLGIQSARNWVLLANFADKSLMRNFLAYSFAKRLRVPFAHDQRHVDVFLNGEYIGNYLFTEHNELHPSRVNITAASSTDVKSGRAVGGYYLETDWRELEPPLFRSATLDLPLTIKAPSGGSNAEVVTYVKKDFDGVEATICSAERGTSPDLLGSIIDIESFITSFWVHEVFKNAEMWTGSTYLFRPLNGRLSMGPVWDFDIAGGNIDYDDDAANPEGWRVRYGGLFLCLFESEAFREQAIARWHAIRSLEIPAIFSELDSLENHLKNSAGLNFDRWPILNEWVWPNPAVYGSYQAEVNALRSWLRSRVAWIDRQIESL